MELALGRCLLVGDLGVGVLGVPLGLALGSLEGLLGLALARFLEGGGRVLGLCGGYQMLGRRIADPQGIEGPPGEREGVGLLNVETVLTSRKTLESVVGVGLRDVQVVNALKRSSHASGHRRSLEEVGRARLDTALLRGRKASYDRLAGAACVGRSSWVCWSACRS